MNLDTIRFVLETEFAKRYGRLVQIIQSNIFDFVTVADGSITLRPLSEIDPDRLVALKSYQVRQTRQGQRVKIALHDKAKAGRILMAVYQAHDKRLDRIGVVVGAEPASATSTRPAACVTSAERPQAAQRENMTELAALFAALDIEWPTAA